MLSRNIGWIVAATVVATMGHTRTIAPTIPYIVPILIAAVAGITRTHRRAITVPVSKTARRRRLRRSQFVS